VTVTDVPVTKYTLTVNNGTGSGSYAENAEVPITADTPASDKEFDKWESSGGGTFLDENESTTTFIMPAGAATVTATYRDAPPATYVLTVNNGTGSGSYEVGTTVTIVADAAPASKVFDKWTATGGGSFADAGSATTTFTMPAGAATVTASYKDAPVAPVLVTTVTIGGGTSISAKGGTLQLTANVAPANAANKAVAWAIVSGSIHATVNDNGLVTAKGDGTAVVRATAQDGSGAYGDVTITITGQTGSGDNGNGGNSGNGSNGGANTNNGDNGNSGNSGNGNGGGDNGDGGNGGSQSAVEDDAATSDDNGGGTVADGSNDASTPKTPAGEPIRDEHAFTPDDIAVAKPNVPADKHFFIKASEGSLEWDETQLDGYYDPKPSGYVFIARDGVSGDVVITHTDEDGNRIPLTVSIADADTPLAGAVAQETQTGFPWWILAIVGAAIIAGITILLIRRRNRKDEESTA
jgi:LPXTG-motif cell wall-anchored protein